REVDMRILPRYLQQLALDFDDFASVIFGAGVVTVDPSSRERAAHYQNEQDSLFHGLKDVTDTSRGDRKIRRHVRSPNQAPEPSFDSERIMSAPGAFHENH